MRLILPLLGACSGDPEGAAVPAAPPPAHETLAPWEVEVLGPVLAELRSGIQPVGEQGFGLCRGRQECEAFLGTSPGTLAPGDYFLRAELRAPPVGRGWSAQFRVACDTTTPGGRTRQQEHERTYGIRHLGPERGTTLQPLWQVQSPHPSGARTCTYSLTPIRPDGTPGEPWVGAYETPPPEAVTAEGGVP